MKPGRVILVFTLAVFFGGALLAPWLYWLAQWGADHWAGLRSLAANPFHRFVNRSLLVLALAGIWPLMRALGAGSWRQVGWVGLGGQASRLAAGFGLGFVSLAVVGVLALLGGGWNLRSSASLGKAVPAALASALVVAVLEETFFRGAIMGALRRAHSATFALVLSSAIYALLHFFQRPAAPDQVHWFSGLALLPQMMRGFVTWRMLVPDFFNLALVGIILGLAYQRTGNLYFSVGLHGGWVFWLKIWGEITTVQTGANPWLWGSAKLIDGWLTLLVLAAVLMWVWRCRWLESNSDHVQPMDQQA